MYEYVRYGRTKIVSAKPHAAELAGGLLGGYPEMLRREDSRRRQAWARDYVKAIVQRDVREIAEVEKLDQLPRLLQALAHQSGQLTNFTQIGGQIGMDDKTTRNTPASLNSSFSCSVSPRGSAMSLKD
jgi:predicted AAA+ superfamily ATPase